MGLTKQDIGKKVSCKIKSAVVKDGEISYHNGRFIILQNEWSGYDHGTNGTPYRFS